MSDTFITFHGWVGAEVKHRTPKNTSVATVRVAVTPRVKKGGDWVDGETTWYSVTAWRTLADHVRDSVRKGDAVIVHGRLRTETWRPPEGPASTTLHVEASYLGHDLSRGTSRFVKGQRPERLEQDIDSEVAEMIQESAEEMAPVDSWGDPLAPEPAAGPAGADAGSAAPRRGAAAVAA